MDNRVVSVLASKKRRKKKKPRPDALPNLPEIPVGNSTSTPTNNQPNDNPNSSVLSIPQLTITPPEDDGNREIYVPPEVNILSQSSSKRKKKKKKQPVLPVVKDEVRPSVVLGYTPRSLCKSVIVQPTVSELEEVCEEAEEEENESTGTKSVPRSSSFNSISQSVLDLAEETSELLEEVSLNCSESAYESAESGRSSCVSDIIRSPTEVSGNVNHFEEQVTANGSQSTCVSESTSCTSQFREPNLDSFSYNSCSPSDIVSTFNGSDDQPKELIFKEETLLINGLSDKSCTVEVAKNHSQFKVSKGTSDLQVEVKQIHESTSISSNNSADCSKFVSCSETKLTSSVFLGDDEINSDTVKNQAFDSLNVLSKSSSVVDKSTSSSVSTAPTIQQSSGDTKTGVEFCATVVEAMPEIKSDVGQKTKAQLKAERKQAFEAQRALAPNTSSATGEAKTVNHKPAGVQKTKLQQKAEKKTANDGQKESKPTTDTGASPAEGVLVAGAEVKAQEAQKTKEQLKAERKAAFEAQKGAQIAAQKSQNAQKSKADLRAERRAIQEAQRANKDSDKVVTTDSSAQKKLEPSEGQKKAPVQPLSIAEPTAKKLSSKVPEVREVSTQKTHLFSHLPQFQWDSSITSNLGLSGKVVHPAIIRAGLRMAQGFVSGSDARCVTTLAAFREVIQDYTTPPQKELSRDLDSKVKAYTDFLKKCRPLSVSMINAIKELRRNITQIPSAMKDTEAKEQLINDIDNFIHCQIVLSKKAIADFASQKMHDNDVILIYGCSPLVKQVLLEAQVNQKKKFKVIVVDARPSLEGREMVQYLIGKKINCSYVLINAVSYVMKEVNLVLLDCHSLQANGYVMSRVGSSQIALVAQASNVPVLVCCETYKFWDRVHTDAFVDNELGNPEDLVSQNPKHMPHLDNWKNIPHLNLVNMTYDVTPADLVTAVVTELGTLPCTSVLAVLRVKHHDPKSDKKKE